MKDYQEKRRLLKQQLMDEMHRMQAALETLKYSEKQCADLHLGDSLSQESLESLEALTSRFA